MGNSSNYPDLSQSNNPYQDGKRNSDDLTSDTGANFAGTTGPAGYWTRPQGYSGEPENPHSGGAGVYSSGELDLANGLLDDRDSLYGDIVSSRQPRDPNAKGAVDYNTDQGYGASGTGRS